MAKYAVMYRRKSFNQNLPTRSPTVGGVTPPHPPLATPLTVGDTKQGILLIESAPIKDKIPSTRLSVEKIITFDRAIMVHKILKKRCPENLKGKFMRRTQILPKSRLDLSKKFSHVGARV